MSEPSSQGYPVGTECLVVHPASTIFGKIVTVTSEAFIWRSGEKVEVWAPLICLWKIEVDMRGGPKYNGMLAQGVGSADSNSSVPAQPVAWLRPNEPPEDLSEDEPGAIELEDELVA